ncbi:MAG: MarR family transcriptional regulator [Actinomycetia bacterium]|nr:MarR family transcriptional regulator [Actinomycetes bacterium]
MVSDTAEIPETNPPVAAEESDPQMQLLMECLRSAHLLQRLHFDQMRSKRREHHAAAQAASAADAPTNEGAAAARHRGFGALRGQGRLLALLQQEDGVFIKDIVMALDIRPSSASELVAKLEKLGLLRVENDNEDKRARRLFLTEEGRRLAESLTTEHHQMAADLFDGLTAAEKSQLLTLLQKMNAALSAKQAVLGSEASTGWQQRHQQHLERWNARHEAEFGHRHHSPRGRGPIPEE